MKISPSSLAAWLGNKEEFYLQRILRKNRQQQTAPMAAGTAFDCYVKDFLSFHLLGVHRFEELIQNIEIQNRPEALRAGEFLFREYKRLGALGDLICSLNKAKDIRMEFSVDLMVDGIMLTGRPDCFYIDSWGRDVILDWKVNGFYSKASPVSGYVVLRGGKARGHDVIIQGINCSNLDNHSEDWARQLCIYGWLLGTDNFVAAIDQLVCGPGKVRIAEHRSRISKSFAERVRKEVFEMNLSCNSDWYFRNMQREDSIARCELLANTEQKEWNHVS